jgi:hypothetical protein
MSVLVRKALLSLVALVGVVGALAFFVFSIQAGRLSEPVVREAAALEARSFELPAAPESGSVFGCLGPEIDSAPDLSRTMPWTSPTVMQIGSGARSVSTLTADERTEFESQRAWLERALACGRKKTVTAVPGLGPFPDFLHGRRQSMPRAMETLSSLAPLRLREALERNAPGEALELCASVLVITTGWLKLEGLESMLPTMGPSRAVLPACSAALLSASPEESASFKARLHDVAALAPTYAEIMKLERTQLALRLFGAWIPPALEVQLPPDARGVTHTQRAAMWDRGVLATLALRFYWRRFDAGMRDIEAASALPPTEREAGILAAQKSLQSTFLRRFMAADPVDLRYQMYAVYLDNLRGTLESLGR